MNNTELSTKQSPIFSKTYDLLLWLLNHTEKFPKSERFRMARRLEDTLFYFYELLMQAARSAEKMELLDQADLELEKLRFYLRMSHDRGLTSLHQVRFASSSLDEIGRLIGGWKKSL